ncbi:MAG: YeiH family protein, partial [Chloroflexota bacterium]
MIRSPKALIQRAELIGSGLAVAAVVAAVSRTAAQALPGGLSEILLAVWIGLVIASIRGLPAGTEPGLRFAQQRILRIGIIFLGARLSLSDVASIGFGALGLVLVCMVGVFAFVLLMGNLAHLPRPLVILIGVGTAVCGNSAIIATAPVVQADEREVSFAVATITIFGTLAVFFYPLMGTALQLSNAAYGVWTGVAVNDTSQVVAASAAYSSESRDVATVVKLVRNTLMAPLILLIAVWWSRVATSEVEGERARQGALKAFPLFVLGFLAMALLRTVGIIDVGSARILDEISKVCILVALAAVGLSTRLGLLRAVGPAPFLLG